MKKVTTSAKQSTAKSNPSFRAKHAAKEQHAKEPSLRSLAITRGTLNKAPPQRAQPRPSAVPVGGHHVPGPRQRRSPTHPSTAADQISLRPEPHTTKSKHKGHDQRRAGAHVHPTPSLLATILEPLAAVSRFAPISPYLCIAALGLVLRAAVARHSWSGRNTPPMFGDFEAQRHWLEITWHLPLSQWYRYDLQYWGLDYPPLTAYVSWVFGAIAHFINPSWVALDVSRGNESPGLVAYMRATVLLSDLLVYLPVCLHFVLTAMKRHSNAAKLHGFATLMLFPGLVLIDHGHFQYNLIMLGLAMYAFMSMAAGNHLRSAVAFSLALLFKQMALYFALPVFVFLLSKCVDRKHGFSLFVSLGATVLATFAVHLYPFRNDLPHLAHRIFPVARGLYEDKVANLWCSLSPVLKLRTLLPLDGLVRLSLATTLLASLPSLVALFRKPTLHTLLLANLAVSLSFFLFAFQVHEKSILLPLTPAVMLLAVDWQAARTWLIGFVALGSYSMWPLLARDGVAGPYAVLTAAWCVLLARQGTKGSQEWVAWVQGALVKVFLCTCLAVHAAEAALDPPKRYPDLYVVANQLVSFAGFLCVWAKANWEIWQV